MPEFAADHPERDTDTPPRVEALRNEEALVITASSYELAFLNDKPYIELKDDKGETWASLPQFSSLDTTDSVDETLAIGRPTFRKSKDTYTITIPAESTAWKEKRQVWKCRPDSIEMYHEVKGGGSLTVYDMLGGRLLDTKNGYFPAQQGFDMLFTPEPTSIERPFRNSDEPAEVNITGACRPGNYNWLATPAQWCFGGRKSSGKKYLMMGIAAPLQEQTFNSFRYQPFERSFSLRLDFDGHNQVDGAYQTPSLLMHFSADAYSGLRDHREQLNKRRLLPKTTYREAEWWSRPIYCGWGSQSERARLLGATAQELATQTIYDEDLRILEKAGVWPSNITIDDKWQLEYATNHADTDKWPDLAGWIERRHSLGQKVLLWLKAWDTEGADPDWCITRPDGKPLSIDPSHPDWQDMTYEAVRRMLGEDGYGADGLKIDFTAYIPRGRNLKIHGPEAGASLLHKHLEVIYRAAKETNTDSLIVTHTPNPQFADVTDMLRLNDVHVDHDVIEQMKHRALIARAAMPDHLIDTDNWPMKNRSEWRRYLALQRYLGVPALYYASRVASQPLTRQDYERLRELGFRK